MKRGWGTVGTFCLAGTLTAIIATLFIPPPAQAEVRLPLPAKEKPTYPIQTVAESLAESNRILTLTAKYLTDKQVLQAMQRGTDQLLTLCKEKLAIAQRAKLPEEDEGELMIGIYALLYMYRLTGQENLHFTQPDMAPLVKYLCDLKTTHTYSISLQASALALLPEKPEFRNPLKAISVKLIAGARGAGNYTYHTDAKPGVWDNSNSQYGVLGVWAVDDAGIEVNNAYWKMCDTHWRRMQTAGGGWQYKAPEPGQSVGQLNGNAGGTPSMTAAGLASLYVMAEHLDTAVRLDPVPDVALEKGLVWLTNDFPGTRLMLGNNLYTAYGIERVGLASGYKYFGKYDWYRDGAAAILTSHQQGIWRYHSDIVGTSYALLFLARGRIPVAFTKLQYTGPWNARPRDVANLSKWLYKRTERYINWQIVSMKNSEPEDWLDGPILVFTGHGDPHLTKEEIEKLSRFVRAGGLIFSSSDGDDKVFTDAIVKNYAPAIFGNAYEMRLLPREHYVYSMDYKLEADKTNDLMGLSNGVRECWIHSPKDMGASWQRYATAKAEHFNLPMNIYMYASGRATLRSKLNSVAVIEPPNPPTLKRNIARLKYAGNYDPEPGAFERFTKLCGKYHDTVLTVDNVSCEELDVAKNPVVHMTGSTNFTLGQPQAEALRKYLEKGGFLIADEVGGSGRFYESLKASLSRVFKGEDPKEVDITKHPVLTGKLTDGTLITEPEMRKFCTTLENKGRKARVWEYKIKDRVVALVFEADVTSGLLGTSTWGIFGYTSNCSEAIMWNALLYSTASPLPAVPPK